MPSRRLVALFALGVAALAAAVLITGTRSAVRRAAPPLPRQVLTPPAVTLASLRSNHPYGCIRGGHACSTPHASSVIPGGLDNTRVPPISAGVR